MTIDRQQLRGTFTALVTPMNKDGSVDFAALGDLVDWQIDAGIDGLVPCGTTGESATLSTTERAEVINTVAKRAGDRVPVIAGAGANATAMAIEHQKRAADTGAICSLVVTPYYNKPTPAGLYRHYEALLAAADIPIVMYNVPGRTGCDVLPSTVARLAELEGIVGIKEATGDLDRVAAIREGTAESFAILSGDDGTACPFAWLGGDGVISVASNVCPKAMVEMMGAALAGDVPTARRRHRELRPLFAALFLEANPIPVKAALTLRGQIGEHYRLPLVPMATNTRAQLESVLGDGGWLS